MKYITTFALALVFTASVALAGEKPVDGKIVCAKCKAGIAKKCAPAFTLKGKDGKEQTLLLAGKLVKGNTCEGIEHGEFCSKKKSVAVTITGSAKDGKFTATKIVRKK